MSHTAALGFLRRELKAFSNRGLGRLQSDLMRQQENGRYPFPARRTWRACPLSYRMGGPGSVREDSDGHYTNEFTLAWDGEDGMDYLDEAAVLRCVQAEIERRRTKRASSRPESLATRKRRAGHAAHKGAA